MGPIAAFYQKLISIGITDELSFSEKLRVELNNLFLGIALPCLVAHLIFLTFRPFQISSYIITSVWIVILLVPLYLNYRRKYFAAKIYTIMVPVLAVAAVHLLHGWNIRMEPPYLMMILLCSFFFKRQLTILMSAFVAMVFIGVAITLSVIDPPLANKIIPTVPFIYLIFSVVASIILVRKVLVENEEFNQLVIDQNEDLAQKNKQLEKFTYIASHDLKTPIRNVTSFASLIERDLQKASHDNIPEHLAFIKSSALQMSALVEDILQISTIDYADAEVRGKHDLDEIIDQVEQAVLTDIDTPSAQVINRGLPTYHCSRSEMYLVFQNLIQNGLKYNQSKTPTVELWAETKTDKLQIHVQDNGIGIESQYHDQVFEFFKRLHPSSKYEGTGLGLALCKRIIEGYDGRIWLRSKLGGGSTFVVELPLDEDLV